MSMDQSVPLAKLGCGQREGRFATRFGFKYAFTDRELVCDIERQGSWPPTDSDLLFGSSSFFLAGAVSEGKPSTLRC